MGPVVFDLNKRQIPLSMIQLTNGHCNKFYLKPHLKFFNQTDKKEAKVVR